MTSASRFGTPPRGDGGFSLIELLCVLVILIILTVVLDNRMSGSRHRSQRELCRKNLLEISLALNFYRNDNHGTFPLVKGAATSAEALSLLIPRCTTETAMFICPGSRDPALPEGESFAKRRISYAYYMGRSTNAAPDDVLVSDWQLNSLAKMRGQPIFSADGKKPANNHAADGGNLLKANGEVTSCGVLSPRDFPLPSGVTLLNPAP